MANREANIWLTVVAVLFVVLMAWLWNSRLAGMVSDAAGLRFGQNTVWITDSNDKPIKADFISPAVGSTIKLGFRSTGAQSCTPSWQPVPASTRYLAPTNYQVTGDVTLSVICYDRKGVKVASDLLQITTGSGQTSGFPVSKPAAGEVWELGKTYEIVWKAAGLCGRSDLGCDANPIDPEPTCTGSGNSKLCTQPTADNSLRGRCDTPNADCSDRDVINCVKAPCPGQPFPANSTVTISLNQKLPDCINQNPACLVRQIAPYVISQSAPNNGTFSWNVPTSLPDAYRGEQQITITINESGLRGQSAVFFVGSKTGVPPVSSTLRVTAPNGGEQWPLGQTRNITWTDSSATGNVKITLNEYRDCSQACTARLERQYTLSNSTPNDGSFSWPVGTSTGATVIAGQYKVVITNAAGVIDESDGPFTITGGATTDGSGIEGTVTIGPSCPGAVNQNDAKCDDKPYKANFVVKTANGSQTVKTFSSDANGTFRVSLNPGTYLIASGTGTKYPAFSEQTVTVEANTYTKINLYFDSGIR